MGEGEITPLFYFFREYFWETGQQCGQSDEAERPGTWIPIGRGWAPFCPEHSKNDPVCVFLS